MSLSEFGLIKHFFEQTLKNHTNILGIGDDCALMEIPDGYQLAVTTDTMVEAVHFFKNADPRLLGHKLLAVNLSDLASMGAQPVAVTLALTMPSVDEHWLSEFSAGFLALAEQYQLDLIGGDTTKGALTLTVQAMGLIPKGRAMKRSNANVGDLIYLTGNIGDAGLGLKIAQGYQCSDSKAPLQSLNQPLPKVEVGLALREIANACIDISDGLVADLGHILEKSQVGACINLEKIPLSNEVKNYIQATGDWKLPLIAGDDYQLCFTISPENVPFLNIACDCIGIIESQSGLRMKRGEIPIILESKGYQHFS
ncbi:MAG: thiamine-phosphate kinase [Methylococcales bacterium]|nr:thiamine-phosphate kinase [Methylococcales bacterium]